ncbi:Variant surface glycoprotein [Trypanosoma congolense IL3000]|uniref:Variant surface glycoprotein n=1 Tax=Trypanosoma congolense (strain IL3000) TaxID=1068625 RepID=F9W6L5_TRYCI|nr:Variant surface glycoprotein [Trypanosoma congolense IL3000]
MMTMKLWMVVMVMVVGVGAFEGNRDYNVKEYEALCAVLKAAVSAFQSNRGSEGLKQALHRTIFGNKTGGNLQTLRSTFPTDYEGHEIHDTPRSLWCGDPPEGGYNEESQVRTSGHSAPHGLLCLCTTGKGGWPLSRDPGTTLCGKDKSALGGASEGWVRLTDWSDDVKGKEQREATWDNVTRPCLHEDGRKGENLNDAFKKFKVALVRKLDDDSENKYTETMGPKFANMYINRYQLGNGNPSKERACDGTPELGICLLYYDNMYPLPWWKDLEDALNEEEREKRRQEEIRKQESQSKQQPHSSELPHAEPLKSSLTTTHDTKQKNQESDTAQFSIINMKSGTSITTPLRLLSAAFLI